jgi:hypothetical protein
VAALSVNGSGQNVQSLERTSDRDEMSHLYRGPSIDASYQVSVRLARRFQRRTFLKTGQSETRIACGGHVC